MKIVKSDISLQQKIKELPPLPGVYIMKDSDENVIYIGKAKNLKNRVSSYFINGKKSDKVQHMVASVFTFEYVITNSESEAFNLESNLIRKHKPFYNILLKDSKDNSFIKINIKKEYPTLEVVRNVKRDGAKYFGPFFQSFSSYQVVQIISSVFMLNDFKDTSISDKPYERLWLNTFLGKIKPDKSKTIDKSLYNKEVIKIMDFLNGNLTDATNQLMSLMMVYAEMQNFEKALQLRENLKLVEKLSSKIVTELATNDNSDFVAYSTDGVSTVVSVLVVRAGKVMGVNNFFVLDMEDDEQTVLNNFMLQYYEKNSVIPKEIVCNVPVDESLLQWLKEQGEINVKSITPQKGIRKKLLDLAHQNAREYLARNINENEKEWQQTIGAMNALQQSLSLKHLPARIECFDISNMQGTHIVASMVVFVGGKPLKKHYRKFKIKTVEGKNNDFESMREVITRRFENYKEQTDESFSKMPSLVVIDGGKGQLSEAVNVLNQLGITQPDLISLAKRVEEIFLPNESISVYLSRENQGLKLLQRARDEAHRFAITFHRSLRAKNMTSGTLEKIPGIGTATANKLVKNFKSVKNVKTATITDLVNIGKVNKTVAKNIFDYFNKSKNDNSDSDSNNNSINNSDDGGNDANKNKYNN